MDGHGAAYKFNIVDVVIVALLLVAGAAGAYKLLYVNRGLSPQTSRIYYTMLVENVRKPVAGGLRPGDRLFEAASNGPLGRVVSVSSEPYPQPVPTLDGRIVLANVPERLVVKLRVEAGAVVTPSSVTTGGKEIRIGSLLNFKTRIVASRGTVVSVEVLGAR